MGQLFLLVNTQKPMDKRQSDYSPKRKRNKTRSRSRSRDFNSKKKHSHHKAKYHKKEKSYKKKHHPEKKAPHYEKRSSSHWKRRNTPHYEWEINQTIRHYKIKDHIADGTSGRCLLVKNKHTGKYYAAKVIKPVLKYI